VLTECVPDPVVPEVPVALLMPLGGIVIVGGWFILNRRRLGHTTT
jgi:hypothetical protein